MCKWGSERQVTIEQEVMVDACIVDEIVELNRQGVRTEESCCGHGKVGHKMALIRTCHVNRARELGYKVIQTAEKEPALTEIRLKGRALMEKGKEGE